MTQSDRKLLGNEIQQERNTFSNCFTMAISEWNQNWATEMKCQLYNNFTEWMQTFYTAAITVSP
jgi:hypothetical protein